jgi:hypothetical protein
MKGSQSRIGGSRHGVGILTPTRPAGPDEGAPAPTARSRKNHLSQRWSGVLRAAVAGLALGLFLALAGGCQSSGQGGDARDEGRALFTGREDRVDHESAWSIYLLGISIPSEATPLDLLEIREDAAIALDRVRSDGGLPQAFVEETPRQVMVLYGRYSGPDSPRAQADLRRIKAIEMDGSHPFAGAALRPPLGADIGGAAEYDLRRAREYYGPDVRYTLQVAIYGREDNRAPSAPELAELRRAAERAVLELRREGEPAFYFHGPYRSTVTVGALSEEEAFVVVDRERGVKHQSPLVEALMARHPHNLVNGSAVRERVGRDGWRLQRSRLVAIPE